MKKGEIKARFSRAERQVLEEKAKAVGKSIKEYTKDISKKAKVSVEVKR